MANELRDLISGAADAKARRFASEDFAGGYGHSVTGRVRRRRVVRAAGVGGATVVGASAIAVGAVNLPGGSLGFTPRSQGTVVCTTAEPFTAWAPLMPSEDDEQEISFAEWGVSVEYARDHLTIVDTRADGATTVVSLVGEPSVAEGGGVATLRQHEDGTYSVPLSEGRVVTFRVVPYETPEDAEVITLEYRFPSVDVAVDGPQEPVVTCVTSTPEPTKTAESTPSATPSPSVAALQSPSPSPEMGDGFGIGASPFQCGFEFLADEYSDGVVAIGSTAWISPTESEDKLTEWYRDPELSPLMPINDDSPLTGVTWTSDGHGGQTSGAVGTEDPGAFPPSADQEGIRYGAAYVLTADGVVVATYIAEFEAAPQFVIGDEPATAEALAIHLVDGMTACEGADPESLADAQVVVVGGASFRGADGAIDGPHYAWKFIDQP